MKNVTMWILLLASFVALPMTAFAQEEEAPLPTRAQERVEQFKKVRMMEVLALDEQTAIKFFARYDKHREALRNLRQRQLQAAGTVQRLRKNKGSDAEFDNVLREFASVESGVSEAKQVYMDQLREVLTKRQLAEYLAFEMRFQQDLRDLAREVQKNRNAPRKW